MIFKKTAAALLATAAIGSLALPAYAQDMAAPSAEDQASEIEFLKAQLEAMQAQIGELQKSAKSNTPTFKGAPLFEDKGAGWSFKPRGRLQYDAGYVSNPDNAIGTKNLGFNSRARRLLLGAEGTVPGGFKYKAEFNFAPGSNQVSFEDVLMQYAPSNSPLTVTIGYFYPFSNLEIMTSSAQTTFLERAQMNDAFAHERRIGLALGYASKDNVFRFDAGIFNDGLENSYDNDGWVAAARATYSPEFSGGRLHLGANYEHRKFQSNVLSNRYRARPFVQTTDVRFVDTSAIAAKSDDIFGVELAGIFGPLHGVAEAQWLKVKGYRPGATFDNGDVSTGSVYTASNPDFFSWYAEVGYFLTGETRGYKNGAFDRTKVLNPINKGGLGAFQIAARYDVLDLKDSGLQAGGISTNLSRGGKQKGILLGLNWMPMDYVKFMLQYAHADVTGGPNAALVKPASAKPINERSYGVDSVALRAQIDF